MRTLLNIFATATLVIASSAFALTLNDAKSKGMVGETMQGYLAVVVSSPEVKTLVKNVNDKRRQKYQQLAKKNNISLQQVEKLAAQRAYNKTASGHYIQQNGKWIKK